MKQVKKNNVVREVRDNQVERHVRNGWTLISQTKKNTEETPAVEVVASEQGEYEANLKENNDE